MSELIRVTRGVWRPAEAVDDLAGRCAALLHALPASAVIAGVAAARLHGLWLPRTAELPIDVIVHGATPSPRDHARSGRPEVRIRRRILGPDDVAWVGGLPVTSLPTTWLHLAERLRIEDLVAAGDSAVRAGASLDSLASTLRRARRQRGIVAARAAVDLLDPRSRSRPESWLRVGLVTRGLVPSGVNTPITDDLGQWLAEPDLSFRDRRLALEYNGAQHAEVPQMRRDITRAFDIDARGSWTVVTVGPVQVFRQLDEVACLVRSYAERPRR